MAPEIRIKDMKKPLLHKLKEEEQIAAIKSLRDSGKAEMLPELIELLATTNKAASYDALLQLFYDLRIKDAAPYFIDAIGNEAYAEEREVLVSVFWQSKLDASEYIPFFVDLAIKSDYMVAFECYTVLDSLTLPEGFNEDEILLSIKDLNEAIMRNNENAMVLESIVEVLNNYLIG